MLNHPSLLVNPKPPPIHLDASSFQISFHQHALVNSNSQLHPAMKQFSYKSPCLAEKENLTNGSILPQHSTHPSAALGPLSQSLVPQSRYPSKCKSVPGTSHTPQAPSVSEFPLDQRFEKLRDAGHNLVKPCPNASSHPNTEYNSDSVHRYSTMISPTSQNSYRTPSRNYQEKNESNHLQTSIQNEATQSISHQPSEHLDSINNSAVGFPPNTSSLQITPSSTATAKSHPLLSSPDRDLVARKQAFLIKMLEKDKFSSPRSWLSYLQFEYSRKVQPEKLISKINQFVFTKLNSAEHLDDSNYLKIWLLYARLHSSPQDRHDIYKKMQVDCIGRRLAAFYVNWAKFEIHHCGINRVQHILSLANEYNAQPVQVILDLQSELLRSLQSFPTSESTPNGQKLDVHTASPCVAEIPPLPAAETYSNKQPSKISQTPPSHSSTPLASFSSSAHPVQHVVSRLGHTLDPQRFTPQPPPNHVQNALVKSNNLSAQRQPTLKSLGSSFRGGAKRQVVAEKNSTSSPPPYETPPPSEEVDMRHKDKHQQPVGTVARNQNPSVPPNKMNASHPSEPGLVRPPAPSPQTPPREPGGDQDYNPSKSEHRVPSGIAERIAFEDTETHKSNTQKSLQEGSSSLSRDENPRQHNAHRAIEHSRAEVNVAEEVNPELTQKRRCTRIAERGHEGKSESVQGDNGQIHLNCVDKPLFNGQTSNCSLTSSESSTGSSHKDPSARDCGEAKSSVRASTDQQAETSSADANSALNAQKALSSLRECWQKASALLKTSVIELKSVPYLNLGLIGKGGSSRVYRVLSPDFTILALKVVSLVDQPPEVLEQYLNEVKLLHSLRGKNRYVIELADAAVNYEKQVLMVLLEYAEIDLHRLLARDPIVKQHIAKVEQNGEPVLHGKLAHDIEALKYYWKSILMAVQIIHSHRIVHGDLKPANFVIVKGQLKLIDFGIAKAINHNTSNIRREDIVGTLNYMAPEAVTPKENSQWKVSLASDVWSLGCILYQMVYGHAPFEHVKNFAKKLIAISGSDGSTIEFPKISNAHLVQIMESCLKRNPADRPTISELLQHEFFDQRLKRL